VIYFISNSINVKIGYTSRPVEERLRELQTGSDRELTLLATMPGEKEDEQYLHCKFRHLHERGEWFKLTIGLAIFIHGIKTMPTIRSNIDSILADVSNVNVVATDVNSESNQLKNEVVKPYKPINYRLVQNYMYMLAFILFIVWIMYASLSNK
jgi:Meiotically up-regulated gene 113